MDLWQEVSPGCGVWYITRELYLSLCVCVANRSTAEVEVVFRWRGDPALSNAVVLAPISNSRGGGSSSSRNNKSNENEDGTQCNDNRSDTNVEKSDSNCDASGRPGVCVRRAIHPRSTVVVAAVSPVDDTLPMTLNFALEVCNPMPQPAPMNGDAVPLENAVKQSEAVEAWLQRRQLSCST
ncbi:hypothetical protein DQ04_04301020 [Trypanosoma grayi]|uniref:hypothetical protein n=1 Tax=Trypanosoma grayi TaxID=71804 RepID=UPI0004F479AB|nr:hypothetical protein DQ04_04301020 [Trypanosoma grayi]KEG10012.1 hypothetical protein DQ04_04301020 [Trypanosoma grayi]